MKKILKKLVIISLSIFLLTWYVNAADYTYFYWEWCWYCANVADFFKKNKIEKLYDIEKKEVYFNNKNRDELLKTWEELWLELNKIWVPFLVNNIDKTHLTWDTPIIDYFQKKLNNNTDVNNQNNNENTNEIKNSNDKTSLKNFWKFFLILLPAALSDSINPCAFAVLFLLLSSILSKFNSYRKAIISWLLFTLAIFISYFLMWIWIYRVLAFSNQIFYLKLWVWILWILVWLANIKDYFWYWKWFIMEVPFAWRPKMKAVLNKVVSPAWAFIAWIIVSLFLLPCTSGPYLTVLWYLASESTSINLAWYIYMFIYNVIFVLPMLIITLIIWFGVKNIWELKEYKEYHKENIHLIVWIMMIALWLYIMWELFLK